MSEKCPHFTPFSYKEAVEGMRKEDGTSGAHWGLDEVKDIEKRNDISFSNFNEYDIAYALKWSEATIMGPWRTMMRRISGSLLRS